MNWLLTPFWNLTAFFAGKGKPKNLDPNHIPGQMKRILATIQGAEIHHEIDATGYETAIWTADMDIDCDGTGGNPFHDPYFQPHTSYKPDLHAEEVPFVVVPPIVIKGTVGIVMGSLVEVENLRNGKTAFAVVGDSGPTHKVGEGSPALAELLGLSGNPNHGGTSDFIIRYKVHVGVPAVVNGVTYKLQAYRP